MNRLRTTRSLFVVLFFCLITPLFADAPNIVMQPANKRTYAGAHVMFSVYSDATDGLTYQWKKNGDVIAGASDPRLVLWNVSSSDVGSYSVLVTDGADTTTSSAATLTLYAPGNVVASSAYEPNFQLTALKNIKAVVNGYRHGMALGQDGKVYTFGRPDPYQNTGGFQIYSYLPQGLTNASVIAVDDNSFGLAIDRQGVVRWWSFAASRELPVPSEARDAVAIAATRQIALVLRADGKVVCWPYSSSQYYAPFVPDNIGDAVAISANTDGALVLHRDGTIVAFNSDGFVPFAEPITNAISIDQSYYGVARVAGGQVATWYPSYGYGYGYPGSLHPTNVVLGYENEVSNTVEVIAAETPVALGDDGNLSFLFSPSYSPVIGLEHVNHVSGSDSGFLCIRSEDTPVIYGLQAARSIPTRGVRSAPLPSSRPHYISYYPEQVGQPLELSLSAAGRAPLTYQWFKNNRAIAGATATKLRLTGRTNDVGEYHAVVKNHAGSITSDAMSVYMDYPSVSVLTVSGDAKMVRTTNDTVVFEGSFPADSSFSAYRKYSYFNEQVQPTFQTNGSTVHFALSSELAAGSNGFAFYVGTYQGNQSVTREVFRVVKSPFTMEITGPGTVTPKLGPELEIGETYTVRATPAPGRFFSYWTANDWSAFQFANESTTLKFTMVSNLVLTAAFENNPFPQVQGVYRGLFYSHDGVDQETSGYTEVVLSANGAFTGRLVRGSDVYRFAGSFMKHPANYVGGEIGGSAQVLLARHGKVPLTMMLYRPYPWYDRLTGYLSDNYAFGDLIAERAVYNPHRAGQYTIAFGGSGDVAKPFGYSYAAIKVDAFGGLLMVGSLCDGTSISQSTSISRRGLWPLYVPLYKGNGSLISWVPLNKSSFMAPMSWIRPANVNAPLFPQGFTFENNLIGSGYEPSGNMLKLTSGSVLLQTADGSVNVSDAVAFSEAGVPSIDGSSGDELQLKVNRAAGVFTGSFVAPDTHQTVNIRGAILSGRSEAAGYFLRTNQSGAVWIQ